MDKFWAMTVFCRVAETGSFSRAAEALDIANASVTACIRNLEKELHVALLHRDTRRIQLTEEGELYLQHARGILNSVEAAESDVQERQAALSGRLVVETPISFGHAVLAPALPDFAREYPNIQTSVTLTNQPHHLLEKAIDVAIRMNEVEDADLVARPIYESSWVACCAPRLAATLPKDPRKLDPRTCLSVLRNERSVAIPWELSRGEEKMVIHPQGALHFNSSDALLLAAEAGVGVILVLDLFARPALARGALVQVYSDWQAPSLTFYSVTTRARLSSAKVRVFTEFLSRIVGRNYHPAPDRVISVGSVAS